MFKSPSILNLAIALVPILANIYMAQNGYWSMTVRSSLVVQGRSGRGVCDRVDQDVVLSNLCHGLVMVE